MTPAIYTTLSYDQKLTYIRQVFVSASATHPVYAKMLHLITGREIQEQYLDMLYDAIHTGINAKTSQDIVAKMGALAILIEDIRRREQADRIQEEARLLVLEQEMERVATY